jgi:acyl-CoA synthetase (AMP-forming)/AMP-acid ligase II
MIPSILSYFQKNSSHVFIRSTHIHLTYSDSLKVIFYLIDLLKSHKLFKKRILLNVSNSVESQLLFLALVHTNDVVLLNPEHNDIFVKHLQHDLDIDLVISDINFLQEITFDPVLCSVTDTNLDELYQGSVCLMSSGTTGYPKPVVISYNNIVKYGGSLIPYFDICADDCLYNIVPFYHGYGLTRLLTVLITGSSVFIPETLSASQIANDINQYQCTWTSLVPRLIKIVNKTQTKLWHGFKFATTSASLVDAETLMNFENITKKPIFVEYGCSEASIISSNTFLHNKPGSMGKIDRTQCKVENGKILVNPIWTTDNEFIDTGDIGFIDNDDFLWLSGRSKEIIKKNGRTIFPFELEVLLQNFSGVEDVAVYGLNTMTEHEGIGVVYVGSCAEQDVVKLCQENLAPFYRPDQVTKILHMPYQGNKLKRLELENYVNSLQ